MSAVGYFPERAKVATIVGAASEGMTFDVRRTSDDAPVWSAAIAGTAIDPSTRAQVWFADFTEFCELGQYYIDVPGIGRSVDFVVADDVYDQPYVLAMRGMQGQRCGAAVEVSVGADSWQHAACHDKDAYLTFLAGSDSIAPSTGGWHDAGDYGKYVTNGAFTVGMMLAAWRDFQPKLEATPLSVPEHGGPIPDYLAEVKWELDWLLTTQQPDGSVVHKVTATSFEGFLLPEQDGARRYYTGVGTPSTGDFVAVMAAAARAYQPYDADFAARALAAAQLGYAYLQAHPGFSFPDLKMFSTGSYGDRMDDDERLWAAAELWETTGDAAVLADAETRLASVGVDDNFDWQNVHNLGVFTYLRSARAERNADLVARLTAAAVQSADNLSAGSKANAYGRAISGFGWGSNGAIARSAMNLWTANALAPDPKYLDTITAQVDHLFGRNGYDRSQVTAIGYLPPMRPHHRPSIADGIDAPWPGLLVGGQNSATTPDWVDSQAIPNVNEIAINWNGALIYALASSLK